MDPMTKARLVIVCGCLRFGMAPGDAATPQRTYRHHGDNFYEEHWLPAKLLPPITVLKSIADRLDAQPRASVKRAFVFTDQNDVNWVRWGKGMADSDYYLWRRGLEDALRDRAPLAEVLSTPVGTVLRTLDGKGRVLSAILRGANPLKVSCGSVSGQLLLFTFPDPKARLNGAIVAYVRLKQSPEPRRLRAVTERLAKGYGFQDMHIVYRRDCWFVFDEDFPVFYPFDSDVRIPSEAEWRQSDTIVCWKQPKRSSCRVGQMK